MIEMLVGLNVTDEAGYAEYRRRMTPLLEGSGGSFGYDFRVSEVLISQTSDPINRVFTIRFPSEEVKEAFYSDPAYVAIKKEFFEPSVSSRIIISQTQVTTA